MLNLNTFKSNTKLTILPTLCDTGKLDRKQAVRWDREGVFWGHQNCMTSACILNLWTFLRKILI